MRLGIGTGTGEMDGMLRSAEMMTVAAKEKPAFGMGEIEEGGVMPLSFDVPQGKDVKIDVGDGSESDRHLVAEDSFGLQPVESGRIAHDDEQVVCGRVAVGRSSDEFAEEQDVFGIEIAVVEDMDDLFGLGGIEKKIRFHESGWIGIGQ